MSSVAVAPQQDNTCLRALYVLNKVAKQISQKIKDGTAHNNFVTSDCQAALRERKTALYQVKRRVLEILHPEASRIEIHEIRGSEFYCFYFGSWSFHTPVEQFSNEVVIDGRLVLPDFSTSCASIRAQQSLEESLVHLREEFNINANDHLDRRYLVAPDGEFIDIGWSTLDTS